MRRALWICLALAVGAATPAVGSDLKETLKDLEKDLKGERKTREKSPPAQPASQTAATQPASIARGVGQGDAAAGVKEALAQGVQSAIRQLGRKDGFLGDAAVRIGAPKKLRKVVDAVRRLGGERYVDEFETSMNRAAEQAVPLAADIFADAVRAMTVQDALAIVRGEPDAATQYFRKATGDQLEAAFLPVVRKATGESGVTRSFKAMTDKAGGLAALGGDVDLDGYVTGKAMDGLFHYVAEQEKAIRANPLGQSSSLLRRVFGR